MFVFPGAVDETGHMPFYSEECASMLAVTFSSGTGRAVRDIVSFPQCLTIFSTIHENFCLISLMLLYFGGLYCKQYGPGSDCSLRSSLIRSHSLASMLAVTFSSGIGRAVRDIVSFPQC